MRIKAAIQAPMTTSVRVAAVCSACHSNGDGHKRDS